MDELFQIFFIQVGLKFLTHNERKIDLHMMTTDLELLGSHFEMIEALEGL